MSTPTHNYKTWVEVSKGTLENNVRVVRGILVSGTNLMAVVKANAYGHGLKEVVSVLKKETGIMFGVDSLEEALVVKSIAPKNEIMILGHVPYEVSLTPEARVRRTSARLLRSGYIPEKNLALAIKNGFLISIYDENVFRFVARLVKTGQINPEAIKAHLKVETGTNRLGMKPSELKNIKFEFPITGVYTHLADSENLSSLFYKEQIKALNETVGILKNKGINPKFIHSTCTAALMRPGVFNGNLARAGIGLYGLWPSDNLRKKFSQKIKLKPVLSWKTRIVQVKCVSSGETVGYDRTYKVKKETSIAVLPVGYYDGYDRKLSQHGEVVIKGKRVKIVGRVCMNMTMVDLGGIKAKTGDEVVLIGRQAQEQITVEELADKIGTINYEIVSRINPLLPRVCI